MGRAPRAPTPAARTSIERLLSERLGHTRPLGYQPRVAQSVKRRDPTAARKRQGPRLVRGHQGSIDTLGRPSDERAALRIPTFAYTVARECPQPRARSAGSRQLACVQRACPRRLLCPLRVLASGLRLGDVAILAGPGRSWPPWHQTHRNRLGVRFAICRVDGPPVGGGGRFRSRA